MRDMLGAPVKQHSATHSAAERGAEPRPASKAPAKAPAVSAAAPPAALAAPPGKKPAAQKAGGSAPPQREVARGSNGALSILWRKDGWGGPKSIGPYKVSIAVVPLPLPSGMQITVAQPWK